jgi:hypothetical protein
VNKFIQLGCSRVKHPFYNHIPKPMPKAIPEPKQIHEHIPKHKHIPIPNPSPNPNPYTYTYPKPYLYLIHIYFDPFLNKKSFDIQSI